MSSFLETWGMAILFTLMLVVAPWTFMWLLARGLRDAFAMIEDIYKRLPPKDLP